MKIATIGKIVSLFAIMVLAYMILTKDTELQYEVKGRVAGFSNTNTSIIIEHEKIEGYMDAMTMPFNVKDTSIITKLEVDKLLKRVSEKKYNFTYEQDLIDYISKVGFDETFGARPIKRAIQEKIEDLISEEVLRGTIIKDNPFVLEMKNEEELIVKKGN